MPADVSQLLSLAATLDGAGPKIAAATIESVREVAEKAKDALDGLDGKDDDIS